MKKPLPRLLLGLLAGWLCLLRPQASFGQHLQLLTNAGHAGKVVSLELNPNGTLLASADEQSLKVWDVNARRVLTSLSWAPNLAAVQRLCWLPGQEVAVLLSGPKPRLDCYTSAGALRWSYPLSATADPTGTAQLYYLPGRKSLALGVQTKSRSEYHLLVLEAATGQLTATSPVFQGCPNGVVEDPSGALLCLFGSAVMRFDPASGQAAPLPLAGTGTVYALRPWKQGFVAMDLTAGVVNWYRAGGQSPVHTTNIKDLPLPALFGGAKPLDITPTSECGKALVVLSDSTVLLRYDFHSVLLAHTNGRAHYLADEFGHVVQLDQVAYSPGRALLAYSNGKELGLLANPQYAPVQGQPQLTRTDRLALGTQGQAVEALQYNAARHELVALTDASGSEVYRFNLDRLTMAVQGDGPELAFSPGAANWATYADDRNGPGRSVRFFKDDFSAPADSFALAPSSGSGRFAGDNELARSADGRRLAMRNRARTEVQVWDVPARKLLFTASAKPNSPDEEPHHFYLDPSGEFLGQEWRSQTGPGNITSARITRVSTGRPVFSYRSATDDKDRCTFCEQGSATRITFLPGVARALTPKGLVDLNTGQLVRPLEVRGPAVFSPQGQYLVSFDSYANRLTLRETKEFRVVKELSVPGFEAAPCFVADSLLALGYQDGIRFYRVPGLTEVATLVFEKPEAGLHAAGSFGRRPLLTDHPSALLVAPDGYFTGSRDAFRLAHFRTADGTLLGFEQVEQLYNRPDVLLRRLGLAPAQQQAVFRQAYEHRLRLQGGKAMPLPAFAPKMVELVAPGGLALAGPSRRLALRLVPTAQQGTARQLTILVNGRLAFAARLDTLPDQRRRVVLDMNAGLNYLSLQATDAQGRICASQLHVYDCQALAEISTTYFVGLGAATYAQPGHNLTYPAKDVADVQAFYQHRLPEEQFKSLVLTNEQVTKAGLAKVRAFLAGAQPTDRVVMLCAGHGLLDNTGTLYLATHDLDFAHPAAQGISFDALEAVLGQCRSRNQLLLLDACHSGWGSAATTGAVAGAKAGAGPAGSGPLVASRGAVVAATADVANAENALRVMERQFSLFSSQAGATVIAAAAGSEVAFESGEYQNGLFTSGLLEGLRTGRADRNQDDNITVSELKDYVEQRTVQRSKGRQRPTARYVNAQADFVLSTSSQTDAGALHRAALRNDVNALSYYLDEQKLRPDLAEPKSGLTALHYAAREGNLEAVVYLLAPAFGLKPDPRTSMRWTPLHLAAGNNNLNVAYWLIFKGADLTARDANGLTPYQMAVQKGHTALAQALQNPQSVVSLFGPVNEAHNAMVAKDLAKFKALIDAPGFNPDALLPYGQPSLLTKALTTGNYEAAELLLKQGRSSLQARYNRVVPLLFVPVLLNDRRLYELLVAHGADPAEKFENFTALEYAAKLGRTGFAGSAK
jgi:ankyrin repeat protein